jgi:hypothetical protein
MPTMVATGNAEKLVGAVRLFEQIRFQDARGAAVPPGAQQREMLVALCRDERIEYRRL